MNRWKARKNIKLYLNSLCVWKCMWRLVYYLRHIASKIYVMYKKILKQLPFRKFVGWDLFSGWRRWFELIDHSLERFQSFQSCQSFHRRIPITGNSSILMVKVVKVVRTFKISKKSVWLFSRKTSFNVL